MQVFVSVLRTHPLSCAMENDGPSIRIDDLQQVADTLYLNYQQLNLLPTRLFDKDVCGVLQRLYAKQNLFTTLPPDVKLLQNLKELYLNSNNLKTLPGELGELVHLELLGLSDNQLASLPESICKLQKLRRLQLSKNQLTHLPKGIGDLQQLQTLELNHNRFFKLPSQISQCISLQQLCVDYNQLFMLPRQLCALSNLSMISACGNKLVSLPLDIGHNPKLEAVYVDNNPYLTAVPSSILQKRLGYVDSGTGTMPELAFQMHKHISVRITEGRERPVLMPAEIRSLGQRCSNCVPPLAELSLRQLLRTDHDSSHKTQDDDVPRDLLSLLSRPTAHCQHCNTEIFLFGFPIVVHEQRQPPGLGLCCSASCVRQCFLRMKMTFLFPKMEDMALALMPV